MLLDFIKSRKHRERVNHLWVSCHKKCYLSPIQHPKSYVLLHFNRDLSHHRAHRQPTTRNKNKQNEKRLKIILILAHYHLICRRNQYFSFSKQKLIRCAFVCAARHIRKYIVEFWFWIGDIWVARAQTYRNRLRVGLPRLGVVLFICVFSLLFSYFHLLI